jgi:ribosomal protein L12E/L44/L45/RPP1/RPP2
MSTKSKDWANTNKALEGKDVKDMLLNVGSGGGAAAPAAGGAAAGGAAGGAAEDAPKEEEKKEEGKNTRAHPSVAVAVADTQHRERGIRRRHGLWSLRLVDHRLHLSWRSQISNMCTKLRNGGRSRLRIVITICAGPTEIDIGRWLQTSGVRARICSRRQYKSH